MNDEKKKQKKKQKKKKKERKRNSILSQVTYEKQVDMSGPPVIKREHKYPEQANSIFV